MANRAVFSFGISIAGDGSSTSYTFNPANGSVFSFGISIAGDGSSTSYTFNPANGSGILGLPTNSAQAVLAVTQNSGPTSPTIAGSVLLGMVTLTFGSALQAVNADLSNMYSFEIALGY